MPKLQYEMFARPEDAPLRYAVEPGKTGVSQDPVAKLLVEKYGVPPEHAVALAPKLVGDSDPVAGEALQVQLQREAKRMRAMKRYLELQRAEESGEELNEAERQWKQQIDTRRNQLMQDRAKSEFDHQRANPQGVQARPASTMGRRGRSSTLTPQTRELAPTESKPVPPAPIPGESPVVAPSKAHRGIRPMGDRTAPLSGSVAPPPPPPVATTADAVMKQFGADPVTAVSFAQQLHGGPAPQPFSSVTTQPTERPFDSITTTDTVPEPVIHHDYNDIMMQKLVGQPPQPEIDPVSGSRVGSPDYFAFYGPTLGSFAGRK